MTCKITYTFCLHIFYVMSYISLFLNNSFENFGIEILHTWWLYNTKISSFELIHLFDYDFLLLFDFRALDFLAFRTLGFFGFRTLGFFGIFFFGCHSLTTSPLLSCAFQSSRCFWTRFCFLTCFSTSSRFWTRFRLWREVFNCFFGLFSVFTKVLGMINPDMRFTSAS